MCKDAIMKFVAPLLAVAAYALPLRVSGQQSPPLMPGYRTFKPATEDLSQYKTADALWQHIESLFSQYKAGNIFWQLEGRTEKPPTSNEDKLAEMKSMIGGDYARDGIEPSPDWVALRSNYDRNASDFVKRFPDDPRRWEVEFLLIYCHSILDQLDGSDIAAQYRALAGQYRALASQSQASQFIRAEARAQLLEISMMEYGWEESPVSAATLVDEFRKLAADFPAYPNLNDLKFQVANELENENGRVDPSLYRPLYQELAASRQPDLAAQARAQLVLIQRVVTPVDLTFTAVDGSKVDLTAMRGKVVLIYFWSALYGPEITLDDAINSYKRLHSKGFEIIGVSLDKDKQQMLGFIRRYRTTWPMTWPQLFDGKGWDNQISTSYGLREPFLLNKEGRIVRIDFRFQVDFQGQVENLLGKEGGLRDFASMP